MTTQTENDLAELSRMKGEDLAKCREELQAERETKMRHWDRVNEEQLKIAAAEIEQLQQACHRAAEICAVCTGRGMYADELQKALGEETEELRRQDVALRCTVNRQQKKLQWLTRENGMLRSSESAKWQDERQAVASDALRWLDERDEARKEIVTLRAKLDVALWKLGNGRAEMATAVAKTNGLRKIVAKCYTFFAAFPRRERDEETHARIQDTVEDLFLVCRAAIGISQAEEADDEL